MDTKDIAICVDHVSKRYKLGVIGSTTLREALQTRWAKARGLEDPNAKIGDGNIKNGYIMSVDDVSFTVKKGECLGIIGRNGAGKSTLLKLICRVTTPSKGIIACNGKVASMLEVGTGFHHELTGRENIYLNGTILGMTRSEISEKIDEIIKFAEIEKFVDTPVKRYSSGMYVRLAFAVSAHLNADIVIMDEVLAVGDVQFQNKCIKRMKEIAKNEGKTILYVSHNMSTIHAMCDRCLVLNKGRLVFEGDVTQAEQIYRAEGGAGTEMDFSDNRYHHYDASTGEVKILEASYTEDFGSIVDEALELRVRWRCNKDVEDMIFRIEVRDALGSIIASKMFENVPDGVAGEECEELFVTDVRALQNGYYTTTYVFGKVTENKNFVTYDLVEGLSFSIDDPDRDNLINWHSEWWGNIRL